MMDDSLLIFEPPIRNSGIVGGKFLERQRVYKPESEEIYTYQVGHGKHAHAALAGWQGSRRLPVCLRLNHQCLLSFSALPAAVGTLGVCWVTTHADECQLHGVGLVVEDAPSRQMDATSRQLVTVSNAQGFRWVCGVCLMLQDLYVGCKLTVFKRMFELLDADEYTYTYMENNKHIFIMADADAILASLKGQVRHNNTKLGWRSLPGRLARQACTEGWTPAFALHACLFSERWSQSQQCAGTLTQRVTTG